MTQTIVTQHIKLLNFQTQKSSQDDMAKILQYFVKMRAGEYTTLFSWLVQNTFYDSNRDHQIILLIDKNENLFCKSISNYIICKSKS